MFITKMALPRRTFLRGVGVTLALPLLEAMVPALTLSAKTAAAPVRRLGFMYFPNGANMRLWPPTGRATNWELSPALSELAPFKDQLIVPIGLCQLEAQSHGDGNAEHHRASANWLNGVHPKRTEGADVQAGTTVDQIAAKEIGGDTPLASLELALEQDYKVGNCDGGYSCVYINTISWRTPTTPNPMEVNPRVVFQRLFGDGGTAAQRLAQVEEDRSILDWVTQDITRLQNTLGSGDRTRVNEYLDAVRELERRIQVAEKHSTEQTLALPDSPIGVPESYDEYAKLMLDLQVLAYQADITRVFTMLLGREQSNRAYIEVGVNEAHHAISHHGQDPTKLEKYHKVNKYHIHLLAYFLGKLQSVPDGDGTLLDHSMILEGAGLSDGDQHSHLGLPIIVAGGGARPGGLFLDCPTNTPMTNLYLAMLDKVGVHLDKFGDSTGELNLLSLSAPSV
jgi:hypothetical protein